MKPGGLVGWKYAGTPADAAAVGMLLERVMLTHDPWPYWHVLFSADVILCRESDLQLLGVDPLVSF